MNSWYRWAISQKGNLFCWTWFLQTRKLVRTEVPEHFSLKISREDTQDPKPKEQSKIQEHNFRLNQNRFCSLQAPAWMNPMADDPGRQRVQESWIILKDHLLLAQDLASLMNKKKIMQRQPKTCMNVQGAFEKPQTYKRKISKWRKQKGPGEAWRLLSM